MAKPVRKRKFQSPATRPESKETPKDNWWGKFLGIRSMAVAIAGCFLLYPVISGDEGYRWVWNSLLKGNWVFIREHRKASLEERNEMKLGFNYVYLCYVKKNTPEDAIILFPLQKHITEQSGNMKLGGEIAGKSWVTHFIYPRRALYKDEESTNPLYGQVTHVAVIAGHGYEDLEYEVQEKPAFAVFPKKHPNYQENK
ncbi:MAG: hypothetical protein LBB73_06215 [Dysgonamonadaceae bacterium]|jgi:hypothetical protein|nr:hypothetical protein [Dysgonamonadaceae bacterium]